MSLLKAELDLLMGADRNGDPSKRVHYSDDKMCKQFLLDFCLHDLFRNTKEDMGPCQRSHSPQAKAEWNKLSASEQLRFGYDRALVRELERWVSKVQRVVDHQIQRLNLYKQEDSLPEPSGSVSSASVVPETEAVDAPVEAGTEKEEEQKQQASESVSGSDIEVLNQQIKDLQSQAETLGEEGDVDASMAVMNLISELESKKRLALEALKSAQAPVAAATSAAGSAAPQEQQGAEVQMSEKTAAEIERLKAQSKSQQQKLRVCVGCGALLSIFDSPQRLADHFTGRMHIGFERIREKLKELREAAGLDPETGLPPRRSRREDRSRSPRPRSRTRDRHSRRSRSYSSRGRRRSRSADRRRDRSRSRSRDRYSSSSSSSRSSRHRHRSRSPRR